MMVLTEFEKRDWYHRFTLEILDEHSQKWYEKYK